jgi:HEAT repeat protein
MREAALDSVATWLPGVPEFEAMALAVLEKERSGGVRRAAVRALKGYASDVSLQAVLEALDDSRTLHAAAEALGGSKHPRVIDRTLERVRQAASAMAPKAKKTDKSAAEKEKQVAKWVMSALGEFEDPRIAAIARELMDELEDDAAQAMLKSASKEDLRALADRLKANDSVFFPGAVAAALRLDPAETFERLIAPFRAKDRDSKAGTARLDAIVRSGIVPTSDRWLTPLVDLVKGKEPTHQAIALLGRIKDKRATPVLLEALERHKQSDPIVSAIVRALADIGDPRALPALLERFEEKRRTALWQVCRAIEQLADVTTVDKVRNILANEKNETYYARHLLRRLENKFPGA